MLYFVYVKYNEGVQNECQAVSKGLGGHSSRHAGKIWFETRCQLAGGGLRRCARDRACLQEPDPRWGGIVERR